MKPINNFKIYDSLIKKYIGNSRKKVWHREYAVLDFLIDLKKRGFDMEKIKVHKFPVESAIEIDSNEFILIESAKLIKNKEKKIDLARGYEKKNIYKKESLI